MCLNLLLDAGGNYAIENSDGDTALDLATRACQRIIEKKSMLLLTYRTSFVDGT